ncbi:MAG: cation diffusion facilitator family transporter [Arcobacteraceae bacterium]
MNHSCHFGLNDHKPYVAEHAHTHHDHEHQHEHNHDDHEHAHSHDHRSVDKKLLKVALTITFITMIAEFVAGFVSNSLALISDAIHMFTHSFALIVSLLAIIIASKQAPLEKTFGYYRAEVLAAFINGITIILSIVWILYEAIQRFITPSQIDIKTAMIVAVIGLVVNIITGVILMQGDKNNINLKSAFVHMLSDALSSVAIIVGYIVIYFTQWYFIDIILALLVALVIGKWAMGILKSSVNTLMESSPLDLKEVQTFIEQHEEVLELHDVHIWEITQDMYNMTAHVKIKKSSLENYEQLLHEMNHELKQKYKIVHTTFQFEW